MMCSFLPYVILSCMLYKTVVTQVSVSANVYPTDGATITLTCSITSFSLPSSWINDTSNGILSTCLSTGTCFPPTFGRYNYSATNSTIVAQISAFDSSIDNFGWKCRHDADTHVFKVTFTTTTISSSTKPSQCELELGCGLGFGIGIPIVITIIVVVIFICTVSSVQTYVGSEAHFNFMLTEDSNESEVHIKNKSGGVVMIARGKVGRSGDPVYKGRVNFTGNTNQKLISFILRNVTLSDAGIYIAVHSDGNKIIGCQALIVKGPTCEDKPPEPDGNKPEQVPLQPIGPKCQDKPPEPDGKKPEQVPLKPIGCNRPYILGLVLGLGLGITFIVGCIIIAILIPTGTISCKLEFGLALVLSLGMSCVIAVIIAVIFICTGIPNLHEFGEGILDGFVIGIIVKRLKCANDDDNPQETDGTKNDKVPLTPAEVSSVQTYVGLEANFSFMLTEDSKESSVLIKNKSFGIVMTARGKKGRSDDPLYKDRVNFTGNTNQKQISFILRNVTLSDAGIYIAVHSDANRIIGCQMLIVKEVSSVQTYVGSEANFNFMLTEDSNESEVHIKNKSGGVVMIARGKEGRSDDPIYKDRVNFTGNMNQKLISFILRNVTLSDAGIYIAVHSDANRVIGCQALIVKDTKSKTNNSGPTAVHTRTQNKAEPNTNSKQTNDRQQLVPPTNTGFEDTPTYRPLPAPPQNGEIKDPNVRGISATIGDTPDLASETPRPIRLLPLTPKQATVQKENASEEPKKKRKNKKKKDQMNIETPEKENGDTDMRVN